MRTSNYGPKLPPGDPDPVDPSREPIPLPNPDEPGPDLVPGIDPPLEPLHMVTE